MNWPTRLAFAALVSTDQENISGAVSVTTLEERLARLGGRDLVGPISRSSALPRPIVLPPCPYLYPHEKRVPICAD